jgi:flavorubredoxin
MRWIEPGGSFDAGDRTLQLFRPPIFDGPTTRGLYDPTTAVMWIVDTFACLTTGPLHDIREVPREVVDETMPLFNSMVSPWHQWLDPTAYRRHVDEIEAMGVLAVASAHGPVITGDAIHEAFDVVRGLGGRPNLQGPGQDLLDQLIAGVLTEAA